MSVPLFNALNTANREATVATDSRALDTLMRQARTDPQGAVKKAAEQFEALFMQMVLKSMREATMKSDLFGGTDSGRDTYTSMLDQQLAGTLASSGTGLAAVIARQLTQHLAPQEGALSASDRATLPRANMLPPQISASGANAARYEAVARTEPVAMGATERGFVQHHWAHALAAERQTGVPAQFIVSQAALESGWGRGEMRDAKGQPSHNLFGIKATKEWQGRRVSVQTTEYEGGVAKKVIEKFRAYESYAEAFSDWAALIARNPRYTKVLGQAHSPSGFAHGLQAAGYATDPSYGEKLVRVIQRVGGLLASAGGR